MQPAESSGQSGLRCMSSSMFCVIALFFTCYDFSHYFEEEEKNPHHFFYSTESKDAVLRHKCYLPLLQAAGNPGRVSCKQEG